VFTNNVRIYGGMTPFFRSMDLKQGTDAGLGDSLSHAAMAAGVAIVVSNSIGVKRPSAA